MFKLFKIEISIFHNFILSLKPAYLITIFFYLEASDTTDLSPRLFKLESATGSFIPTEIVSPSKTDLHNCPFPILQDDLYNVDQPGRWRFSL